MGPHGASRLRDGPAPLTARKRAAATLRRAMRRLVVSSLALLVLVPSSVVAAQAVTTPSRSTENALAARSAGLHVRGNRLLDSAGREVRFHGVNRSGSEYACVQGWGVFDGPSDAASVAAIASWHVNAVRIPLNEQCWLALKGVDPKYSGARYRTAIVDYVKLLHRYGMYAELSLMWAAPGQHNATYQPEAPDADHSPAFWASLAATFKSDRNVVLAPWGETTVNANCFLRGTCEATFGPQNEHYRVAGMQQAVSVMRKAGYRGVIAIPGITYANDLTQWLAKKPRDPLGQLVGEAHIYGKNTCDDVACFERTLAPVARKVPLFFGETGETYDGSSCNASYITTFLRWADTHRVGYFAWTWDTWKNCSALIKDYERGTPFSAYASWVRSHYAATRAGARLVPKH
jgi:endoglucanase